MRTLSLFIFLIMGMTNSYSQVFTFSDLQTKEAPGTVWKVTVDPNKKLVEFYMNDTKMRSFRIYDSKKYVGGFSFSIKQGDPAKDFDAFEKGTCNSVWISSTFLPVILLPLDVDKRWVGLEMKENSRVGRWDIEALRNYMVGNSASSASTKTNATTKPSSVAPRKPAAANPAPNSLIARPALPKKMTEKQMMMHPFGLLKEDLTGFTKQQVAKDMKTLFR